MTKTPVLVLALAAMAFPLAPLAAAPVATQQEADRLKAMFERYVGGAAPGEAATVTVTPDGAAYRASFDVQRMMRRLEPLGLTMDPATEALTLLPNQDGTWRVTSEAMPPLVIRLKDQTITTTGGAFTFAGTFDPKLGLFLDEASTQEGATLDQEAPGLSQHRRSDYAALTQKAVPADADRAVVDLHYAVSNVTARTTMHPPPKADLEGPPDAPTEFGYTIPIGAFDLHADRLRAWSLLDLWAFFVAHPTHDAIAASQDELRGLLRAGLPLLSGFKEAATAESLSVRSSLGEFKAGKAASSIDVKDLAGSGRLDAVMTLEGLVLPSVTLPAWSTGFLPTSLDLRPSLTGFHLDQGAKEAVEGFDLKHDGFTPEQDRKIGHVVWPGDGKVSLAPSRLVTPLLDLKLEGEATVGEVPAGHLLVSASGLDRAIKALQAVSDSDPAAGQVLSQLVAAKNLAKPAPDGSFVWLIEGAANGPLSVNGVALK